MDTSELKIATCDIKHYTPEMGVALRTTVGLIRAFPTVSGSKLAPYGLLKITDREEFSRRYIERIDGLADKVDEQLLGVAAEYPGQVICVLCFEDLSKGLWCHRTLAAPWLEARYGISVPELGPHNVSTPAAGGVASATLF